MSPHGLQEISEEVFAFTSGTPHFGRRDVEFLKVRAASSRRGRARICAHATPADAVQEMLIVISAGSYLQPHRHLRKCESFHVIEGTADVALFDDGGNLSDLVALGDFGSGGDFYCRIPAGRFHTLLLRTPRFVMHEVTSGPFVAGDADMAAFAPPEADCDAARRYTAELQRSLAVLRTRNLKDPVEFK